MHNKCQCDKPTDKCPRYGWMKGRKWEVCQGINITAQKREEILTVYEHQHTTGEPSLLTKAAGFAKSIVEQITAGNPKVSDEEYARRLGICENCPSGLCDKTSEEWVCRACGCSLQGNAILPSKARWATQDCPRGHWPKLELPLVER